MELSAKKVSLSLSVVVVIPFLLLLFSAASFSAVDARRLRSMGYDGVIQIPTRDDDREHDDLWRYEYYLHIQRPRRKYQTYSVLLRELPDGGEAMDDDRDARRRWYESFLPSSLTDSGEPRLLDCYPFDDNGFLARLTWAEAKVLAKKPGVRRMVSDYFGPYLYSPASCGFVTAITKRSFVGSRPAF